MQVEALEDGKSRVFEVASVEDGGVAQLVTEV